MVYLFTHARRYKKMVQTTTSPAAPPVTTIQQPDPFLAQVDNLIEEMETHSNQNRVHAEQGLYTEALPRVVNLFKAIRSCLDLEDLLPLEDQIEDQIRPDGSFLELRYQTVTALEALLIRLYSVANDDPQILNCFYMFLSDLYGYDEEGIKAHLQMIQDSNIGQALESATATAPPELQPEPKAKPKPKPEPEPKAKPEPKPAKPAKALKLVKKEKKKEKKG
jgi:hypothetical protein